VRTRRDRTRRRAVAAAFWCACLIAAIVFVLHEGREGEVREPAGWSLEGVADSGRTLLVRGPDHGSCEDPELRVRELRDGRILVTAELVSPLGTYACDLMGHPGETVRLPLRRPVAGRPVVGAGRRLPDPRDFQEPRVRSRADPGPPSPDVVGLRFRDARHALCVAGFRTRLVSGREDGTVTTQGAPALPRRRPRWTTYPRCRTGALPPVAVTTTG
jgi:hypothetical protein